MTYTREDLEMAERHVAEGRRHLVSQQRIVEEMRGRGAIERTAEELLEEFHATLADHIQHRDRIKAGLGPGSRSTAGNREDGG